MNEKNLITESQDNMRLFPATAAISAVNNLPHCAVGCLDLKQCVAIGILTLNSKDKDQHVHPHNWIHELCWRPIWNRKPESKIVYVIPVVETVIE